MFIKIITVIISFAVPSRRARGFVEQFDILSVGPVRAVPTCQIGLDFFQLRFGVGLPRPFPLTIYTTMIMMKHCLGSTRRYHFFDSLDHGLMFFITLDEYSMFMLVL